MSTTGKVILWVVIIVAVVGGIWWLMASQNPNQGNPTANSAGTNTAAGSSSTLPQGNSDQAISQEMTSVDAQMNGFSSDTASVNQSMNDQPVQQAQ